MGVLRPLRAALFFYECLRVLLLLVFMFIAAPESTDSAFFPYFVYLSANALFPLMALFVWLNPEEHRNYLALYMAGKIISVVSFYVWGIFDSLEISGLDMARSIILLGGSTFINLADILSVWGAWALKNKIRRGV